MKAEYRIIDTVKDYRVQQLCPKWKYKRSGLFGMCGCAYYDADEMIWVNLDPYGRSHQRSPIDEYSWIPSAATFQTRKQASDFLKRVIKVRESE